MSALCRHIPEASLLASSACLTRKAALVGPGPVLLPLRSLQLSSQEHPPASRWFGGPEAPAKPRLSSAFPGGPRGCRRLQRAGYFGGRPLNENRAGMLEAGTMSPRLGCGALSWAEKGGGDHRAGDGTEGHWGQWPEERGQQGARVSRAARVLRSSRPSGACHVPRQRGSPSALLFPGGGLGRDILRPTWHRAG